jgi:hypothetical protein
MLRYLVLFVFMVCLCSWGEKAHRKINTSSVSSIHGKLQPLETWALYLGDHGADADKRKKTDKNEFVRHFIDIDNYEDFNMNHRISENFEENCAKYGKEFVRKNGTLPWVTDSTYQALVQDFKKGNWAKARQTAADLGHYVGDGFMPLHITANYDGQLSNQKGIHARYEETMINLHIDSLQLKKGRMHRIRNVHSFIFSYLYANYGYVAQLLQSDKIAYEKAGNQYNDSYYENLWKETNSFTLNLLQESSQTIASLIYTAWIEAGKPKIPEINQ